MTTAIVAVMLSAGCSTRSEPGPLQGRPDQVDSCGPRSIYSEFLAGDTVTNPSTGAVTLEAVEPYGTRHGELVEARLLRDENEGILVVPLDADSDSDSAGLWERAEPVAGAVIEAGETNTEVLTHWVSSGQDGYAGLSIRYRDADGRQHVLNTTSTMTAVDGECPTD